MPRGVGTPFTGTDGADTEKAGPAQMAKWAFGLDKRARGAASHARRKVTTTGN